MPTIPNIGQMTEQSKNPAVQPSATDLLMAAATVSAREVGKSAAAPFRQGSNGIVTKVAQTNEVNSLYKVPMSQAGHDSPDEYENVVDNFINKNNLREGDVMRVEKFGAKDKMNHYKYLGPNSGGRKDWMQVDTVDEEKMM